MLTKVEIIKEKLLDDIHNGRLAKNDTIPSRHQFMKRYNCARGTIDQAINELTSDGFLYSRQGAGTFVADIPGKVKIEQVVVIGNTCQFESEDFTSRNSLGLAEGIQEQLPCFLYNSNDINVNMSKIAKRGSVILWSSPSFEQLKTMKYFQKLGIPQVLIARDYSDLNYVTTDAKPGIAEGLAWLTEKAGTKSIAVISDVINSDRPYQAERQIAMFQSAIEQGINLKPENIYIDDFAKRPKYVSEIGNRIFRGDNCPKAIFLTEVSTSVPFLMYALACGKEPGKDFFLLTFDHRPELQHYNGVAGLLQRWDLMRLEGIKWVRSLQTGGAAEIKLRIKPDLIIGGDSANSKSLNENEGLCS